MPCAGPSDSECRGADAIKAAAEHIVFFLTERGETKSIPEMARNAIKNSGWGREESLDKLTEFLCNEIQSVSERVAHAIIYNSRSRKARELANWWEDHQELDRKREVKAAKKTKIEEELKRVYDSLTDHQRAVLFPNE
jgi:hypothetical protein